MTGTKHAWQEVAERCEALGLKLKLHLEEERSGHDDTESDDRVREALDKATAALEDVFEALGDAAEDVAVKSDLKELAGSFGSALETTFSDLGTRITNTFGGSQ
ncbi:MAG: hypothetical protein GY724_27605 [Actinomycetia bacterium]|nr:hypothetical protein [Actinomycetes bacterium]MCP4223262.1 hypothetical protein [Actinomycetes bacterium]MCP5030515.1 hypothetical protein [Actinomycetes bacterium]